MTSSFEAIVLRQMDEKNVGDGSMAVLRSNDRFVVLLARGLDRLQVSLCPHSLGRELYDNLKLTADMSKPALRNLRFPINMLNRIAYGISLGSWGARAHNCAPKHYLTTADFAKVSQDAFDNFAPKKDNALEAPPRLITSMLVWHQYSVHQITVFGLVYGREHEAERKHVRDYLFHQHEDDPHRFPQSIVFDLWEELWARWWGVVKAWWHWVCQRFGSGLEGT